MSHFLLYNDNNIDTKALAIPRVFSENSWAKKLSIDKQKI